MEISVGANIFFFHAVTIVNLSGARLAFLANSRLEAELTSDNLSYRQSSIRRRHNAHHSNPRL